jgi:DNA-directed RNA polymerase specialized sigma24 family protein
MTWHELIARAAAGDVDAQDQVVRDFEPRVRRLVHRHLSEDFRRSHHWMLAIFSTRDVVQDILIATVRALETADFPSEEALAAYLATMVRHRLLDAVKHHEAARRGTTPASSSAATRAWPARRHPPQPSWPSRRGSSARC